MPPSSSPERAPRLVQPLSAWRSSAGRRAVRAATVLALAVVIALSASAGTLRPLENMLQNAGFAMRSHPASGQVHVVEMDAASVAAIQRWPWDREHYARVMERLDGAGARTIAFDVDFSTPSIRAQDDRFAATLAGARATVVLPVFGQRAGFAEERQLDSLPIPRLREHALLGSVSVSPASDGVVRDMPIGTFNADAPRPSLSAQLAHRSGAAGDEFPIDFAIQPETLPRHSFIAVEKGKFDSDTFTGKDVVIGATAIEMGDRYATPVHGVLPGVIIQALAAETLLDGVPVEIGWPLPLLLAALFAYAILAARSRSSILMKFGSGAALVLLLLHFGASEFALRVAIAPALLMLIAASLLRWAVLVHEAFEQARLVDAESGMPNRRALERAAATQDKTRVVAAMIDEFDAVKLVIGQDAIGEFLARLQDRMGVLGCEGPIYRIDDRALAWVSSLEPLELERQLLGMASILRSPVEVRGRRVDIKLAFGITDAKAADEALHAASRAARQRECFGYHERAEKSALDQQLSLMGELEEAMKADELSVLYQPKLDLRADRVTSAEALIRWHHPVRGDLRPDIFIPLAEETNRIDELTLFVLRRVIDDMRQWRKGGLEIRAAINISARLITSADFTARIESVLLEDGVPADRLIFEITESATIGQFDKACSALRRFRDLGIGISMDDYGTGQSTLSYLKELPLTELKIDRSFVQHAHRDHADALLVGSTVELAHQLGLQVVAEGIEEAACLDFLRRIGCDYAQGYFIAKPMSAEAFFDTARINKACAA